MKNGGYYKGRWKHDLADGKGTHKLLSGSIYTGIFRGGKKHGSGTLTWPNGNRYEGSFVQDCISGEGTMRYGSGHVYKGYWLDSKRHGHGRLHYEDGSDYVGTFAHDKRHGSGVYVQARGTMLKQVYKGEWCNNRRHGYGEQSYQKDNRLSKYMGSWRDGILDGNGRLEFKDRSSYKCDFKHNQMSGYGKYFGGGIQYSGSFLKGKFHGEGTIIESDGEVYVGNFVNSKRHGKGKVIYVDGSSFIGGWEEGKMVGKGVYEIGGCGRGHNSSTGRVRIRTLVVSRNMPVIGLSITYFVFISFNPTSHHNECSKTGLIIVRGSNIASNAILQ